MIGVLDSILEVTEVTVGNFPKDFSGRRLCIWLLYLVLSFVGLDVPMTGNVCPFLLHLPLTKASEMKRVEFCN